MTAIFKTAIFNRYFSTIALLFLVTVVMGCGGGGKLKTYRVEGTVTYNGAPVEGASVAFNPVKDGVGKPGFAKTDATGKYRLSTTAGNVGAGTTPGEYAVTVKKEEAYSTGRTERREASGDQPAHVEQIMGMRNALPKEYATVHDTPFKFTVEAKSLNEFDMTLK